MYTISYRTGVFRRKVKVLRHEMKDYLNFARVKDGAICSIPAHRVKELVVFADYYTSPQFFVDSAAPRVKANPVPAPAPEASVSHLHPVDSPEPSPQPPPVAPPRSLRPDPAMQTEIMRRAMAKMTQQYD